MHKCTIIWFITFIKKTNFAELIYLFKMFSYKNKTENIYFKLYSSQYNFIGMISGVFFKFHLIVGVEVSIVNALYSFSLRITDYLFKSYSWLQKKKTGNENFSNVNLVLTICQLIVYLTITMPIKNVIEF
jgi:hypothetical protein